MFNWKDFKNNENINVICKDVEEFRSFVKEAKKHRIKVNAALEMTYNDGYCVFADLDKHLYCAKVENMKGIDDKQTFVNYSDIVF